MEFLCSLKEREGLPLMWAFRHCIVQITVAKNGNLTQCIPYIEQQMDSVSITTVSISIKCKRIP